MFRWWFMWFWHILNGGMVDVQECLTAGDFDGWWVTAQEVSPEVGSSCPTLGSGISSSFSHPGHGLRIDNVIQKYDNCLTKCDQNIYQHVTIFYCKHWPCGLSTTGHSWGPSPGETCWVSSAICATAVNSSQPAVSV